MSVLVMLAPRDPRRDWRWILEDAPPPLPPPVHPVSVATLPPLEVLPGGLTAWNLRRPPRKPPAPPAEELPVVHAEAMKALARALGELAADRLFDSMEAELVEGEQS